MLKLASAAFLSNPAQLGSICHGVRTLQSTPCFSLHRLMYVLQSIRKQTKMGGYLAPGHPRALHSSRKRNLKQVFQHTRPKVPKWKDSNAQIFSSLAYAQILHPSAGSLRILVTPGANCEETRSDGDGGSLVASHASVQLAFVGPSNTRAHVTLYELDVSYEAWCFRDEWGTFPPEARRAALEGLREAVVADMEQRFGSGFRALAVHKCVEGTTPARDAAEGCWLVGEVSRRIWRLFGQGDSTVAAQRPPPYSA